MFLQRNQQPTPVTCSSHQVRNPSSKLTTQPSSPFSSGHVHLPHHAQPPSALSLASPVHQSDRWTPRYNSVIMAGGDIVQVSCFIAATHCHFVIISGDRAPLLFDDIQSRLSHSLTHKNLHETLTTNAKCTEIQFPYSTYKMLFMWKSFSVRCSTVIENMF